VGRIVEVPEEGNILVADFWDSKPARIKVDIKDLILVSKASEREDVAVKKEEPKVVQKSNTGEHEAVAKPSRYNQGTIEVWDAIQGMGLDYMQGNIVKYVARYKHKNGIQDLHKTMNYLLKVIANETGQDYYELRKKSIEDIVG
jgi:hypothetical protein